jgi:uncharacterized protein
MPTEMPPETIDELFSRCCAQRRPDGAQDFNASRIYSLQASPFTVWCDYHAPREQALSESNRYEQMRRQCDTKTRDEWISSIFSEISPVRESRSEEAFRATLAAMQRGDKVISRPCLWNLPKGMFGRAGLLIRVNEGQSVFGPYHYQLALFKQALDLKEHYSLQAAFMNDVLAGVQGYEAPTIRVYLKSGERAVTQADWKEKLENLLAKWRDIRDNRLQPETSRPPNGALPPWRMYANKVAADRKDLVMIPGTGWDLRAKLREAGMPDLPAVAEAGIEKIRAAVGDPFAADVFGSSLAYKHGKPVLRNAAHFPPKRGARNLYFDFETSDSLSSNQKPHTYLIGVWDKEAAKYFYFLTKGAEDEEKIFREFIEYVGDPKQAVLYHWTEYEVKQLRDIASKYPALKEGIHGLISCCLDLKESVRKAFYIPAPGFSLKTVAPIFGFHWRQKDVGAMDAMVYYWDWLAGGGDEALQKVLLYNEDDCYSMLHVDLELQKIDPVKL